jgi:hypothetical protein
MRFATKLMAAIVIKRPMLNGAPNIPVAAAQNSAVSPPFSNARHP